MKQQTKDELMQIKATLYRAAKFVRGRSLADQKAEPLVVVTAPSGLDEEWFPQFKAQLTEGFRNEADWVMFIDRKACERLFIAAAQTFAIAAYAVLVNTGWAIAWAVLWALAGLHVSWMVLSGEYMHQVPPTPEPWSDGERIEWINDRWAELGQFKAAHSARRADIATADLLAAGTVYAFVTIAAIDVFRWLT